MHRTIRIAVIGGTAVIVIFIAIRVPAQIRDARPVKRARPPTWRPEDADGVFFRDAFSTALQGQRPENLTASPSSGASHSPESASAPGTSVDSEVTGPSDWSRTISTETIEDEVKLLAQQLEQTVTTPGKFSAGDYRDAHVHFSMLAVLFGIISEYDGDVRWKADAKAARGRFAHVASITKVGTIQVYTAAKARTTDLQDLVRGGRLGGEEASSGDSWSELLDRSPLMFRLEDSLENGIAPWTADAARFRGVRSSLIHEAELVAAIGAILRREGMEDAADDQYSAFCEQLEEAAALVVVGAKQDNLGMARRAAGDISKSCSECHEDYR